MFHRHTLALILTLLLIGPSWSVMLTSASGGNVSVFDTGSVSQTVSISGTNHTSVGFDLNRDTTITTANMFIKPDVGAESPGSLVLDLDQDGQPEWAFDQPNYGDFGAQNTFANGHSNDSVYINQTSLNSSNFLIPYGSSLSSVSMDIDFIPDVSAGFLPLGELMHVDVGDIDNNSRDEVFVLSQDNASTAVGTAFQYISYNSSIGMVNSSWVPTCTNATELMVEDLNNDGHDDVISHAPNDDMLCIHMWNATLAAYASQANYSLPSSTIALDIADFKGDGWAKLVTIRSNGIVALQEYSSKNGGFGSSETETVNQESSQNTATLTGLFVARFDGASQPYKAIVVDQSGYCTQLVWQSSSLVQLSGHFDGINPSAIVGDWDADGDLDFLSSTATGHRTVQNRLAFGWDEDSHSGSIDLSNATIIDHDNDMDASLLIPQLGIEDGNPATFDGNFTGYGFDTWGNSQGEVETSNPIVLAPWTNPRSITFGDLDGDTVPEQLVVAGEGNQKGLFISAWHQVAYDIDHNVMMDVSTKGYGGNGSNGLAPISIEDPFNNLTSQLSPLTFGWDSTVDGYGVEMSSVNLSMYSATSGTFVFSNLSIIYSHDFFIDTNPSVSSNLTNVLNQQMTAGTTTLNIPLLFNSSKNGSFVLHTPSVSYIDGAPNIALPPDPVLELVDATPDRIELKWQNMTDFGNDLIEFSVFRTEGLANETPTYYTGAPINFTVDTNVAPGQTFTYWIQSIHTYGITSNLSAGLTVTVPYPVPASYVPNVTAYDVANDQGGVMQVDWSEGDASIVEHRLYISNTSFTSIENLSAVITLNSSTFNTTTTTDSDGLNLIDATAYYVAVVGFDQYGNASLNVTSFGPVYTRNDTALPTNLSATFEGFTQDSALPMTLLKANGALTASATLLQGETPVVGAELVLHVLGESDNVSTIAMTDENGIATFSIEKLTSLGPLECIGNMTLRVAYEGWTGNLTAQPHEASLTESEAFGVIDMTLTPTSEPILLMGQNLFSTLIYADANDPLQQILLVNMQVDWHVQSSDNLPLSSGTADVRGNEMNIGGAGALDATLYLHLNTTYPLYYTPGMQFTIAFETSSEPVDNETNTTDNETNTTQEPDFPDATLPGTMNCEMVTYAWKENGTDAPITCTITNPNPFDVMVGFAWKVVPGTPPAIELVHNEADGNTPSLTAKANDTVDLTFSMVRNGPTEGMFPGLQGEGYIVSLTCLDFGDNACDTMTTPTASTEGELQWTLGEQLQDTTKTDDANAEEDDASSVTTILLGGIGVFILIGAILGGVVLMRSRTSEFDEDDEEDYYDMVATQDDDNQSTPVDLGTVRSLDDLKAEGKEMHEDPPEELESSLLGSSADAFESSDSVEAWTEGLEESAEESAEEDDGISVDENGTEWWEDEEGVWWYREEGWEDWAVWEE